MQLLSTPEYKGANGQRHREGDRQRDGPVLGDCQDAEKCRQQTNARLGATVRLPKYGAEGGEKEDHAERDRYERVGRKRVAHAEQPERECKQHRRHKDSIEPKPPHDNYT